MEKFLLFGTVWLIYVLLLVTPGPDFIMTIKNSLSHSRRAGIYTAVGISLGMMVHVLYCIFGLALIISQSVIAFNGIKLAGGAYLLYVGASSILSKGGIVDLKNNKDTDISAAKAFRMGFLTNILNPKATLFFLSLFTSLIQADTEMFLLVAISVSMFLTSVSWFSLVAIFFTHKNIQKVFYRFQNIFNKTLGVLLIGLAIKLIFG